MKNILDTILDIKGKTNDKLAARLDLQEIGLRPKLHPFTAAYGKTYMPATCHTMSREDKENFLKVLRNVRVPDGYALNISRCVRLKERTILGLKSHDSHILMQQLLPIALHQSLPNQVVDQRPPGCTHRAPYDHADSSRATIYWGVAAPSRWFV